ncbi:MAG: RNA recognition motif domain-containing protein [Gammaproteobacteria bacterium]
MKKLFIGNLAPSTKADELENMFSEFGKVRSLNLITDVMSGQCKGFGFIEMEGHEARAAIAGLNGKELHGKQIKVNLEVVKPGRGRR